MNSVDLLIIDDDLVLNSLGEPLLVYGADCVAQDIKHMIREKGYLVRLIAQRDSIKIKSLCKTILLEIENDERIYPGTVSVVFNDGDLVCQAKTIDDELLEVSL